MDCRQALTEIDLEFLTLLNGRPLLVLLTKTDKLNQSERAKIVSTVRQHLRLEIANMMQLAVDYVPVPNVLAFSSLTRIGQAQAITQIATWLNVQTTSTIPSCL
jgi:GTP-binding protein